MQGRRIDSDDEPKYLTKGGFEKGRILYNLNNAKNYLGDASPTIIIVEGVTDVWKLFSMGHLNCVSTFGTGVSINQVGILMKYALNVIILFDGDRAGLEAAKRTRKMMLKGFNVNVVSLPEGTDPSSIDETVLNRKLEQAYRELGE